MAEIIETRKISDYEIMTDSGWQDLEAAYKTIPYQVWKIKTKDFFLECADEHIVFKKDLQEVYVKDLQEGDEIMTEKGLQKITSIKKTDKIENMYDVAVKDDNHRFYSNGILSHNSTLLTIFSLWMVCFHDDYRVAIVANKETTAINIFKRIRMAYEQLPNYIKPGVKDYAKTGMTLGNDSSIIVSTTTATSIRGDSLNCLTGDCKITIRDEESDQRAITLSKAFEIFGNPFEQTLKQKLNTQNSKVLTGTGWSSFSGIKRSTVSSPILKLTTESKKEVSCTEDHLLFFNSSEFKQAKNFSISDIIQTVDGPEKIISIEEISKNKPTEVFDVIETEHHHFFANGLQAHNCVMVDECAFIECLQGDSKINLMNSENQIVSSTIDELYNQL